MLIDKRIEKLAFNLVNYSCSVQSGEKVLIDAKDCDYQLVNAIIREVTRVGGIPFVRYSHARITREIMMNITEEGARAMADQELYQMRQMDCYIGIRGGNNSYETGDVPTEKEQIYTKYYAKPVCDLRVNETKWVILRYPTEGMSQLAGMSTEAYEDYYFDVCNLDYRIMSKAMDGLVDLMNRTDRVRIVSPGTDLSFSIKDIPAIKCCGQCNIPDGEVYTAPVRDSVNGTITYNVPSIENGTRFENVTLVFKDGKIIKATANYTDKANAIFDTDEGARYVGEFAIGVNPYITRAIGDILFDEKMGGSIHFTPGECYEDAYNGNQSAVHWDLVLSQTPEHGGGEIWFDDVLIRRDGMFVLPELYPLNPENLK